jgi:hypothetical protein
MEVSSPPGTVIGSIEQEWSILTPQFKIKNSAGDTVLRIEGPICTFSICGDVEFKVGFFLYILRYECYLFVIFVYIYEQITKMLLLFFLLENCIYDFFENKYEDVSH